MYRLTEAVVVKYSGKKGALRSFAKFTGKHLCQRIFFNKVAICFPVNFAKFLRTSFFIEHLRWLLLN